MRAWLMLGTSGCVVGVVDQELTFDAATSVDVEISSGSLAVETSPDGLLRVAIDGGGVGMDPGVKQWRDGSVHVDLAGGLGGGEVEIQLPAGLELAVVLERGDISLELAAASDLDLCMGAGDTSVGLPSGGYVLDFGVGAGEVSTEGIWHDPESPWRLSVCLGAGSVDFHPFDPFDDQ